jgi:hypothetical protein
MFVPASSVSPDASLPGKREQKPPQNIRVLHAPQEDGALPLTHGLRRGDGRRKGMRLFLLALALSTLVACSSVPSTQLLTDAERCARFGGVWSFDTCRSGN